MAGGLDDAGDHRPLGERHVRDVLAEDQPRCLGDAVDRERSALAEIHIVQIELEDLVLRRAPFEHDRHELFFQLPPVRGK